MNKTLDEVIHESGVGEAYQVSQLKPMLKILILETFGDALIESTSVEEMAEKFRKKILSL